MRGGERMEKRDMRRYDVPVAWKMEIALRLSPSLFFRREF